MQQAPLGERGGVLADSNMSPFDFMSKVEFRKFVKHYAPELLIEGTRRDDLITSDGTVESLGLKSMLERRGLTGREPVPEHVTAPRRVTEEAQKEFSEHRAMAEAKMGSDVQSRVESMTMPDLRKTAKAAGIKQSPRDKKQVLIQKILDATNG